MRKSLLVIVAVLLVLAAAGGAYVYFFAGRTLSRLTGGLVAHRLALPDCAEFIGVDFQESGGSTVKLVTYLAFDGHYYTEEFRDLSPLEGKIQWILPDGVERPSWFQTRRLSRLGLGVAKIRLPKDFYRFAGPVTTVRHKSGHAKNVTYWTREGKLKTQEYVDWSPFESTIEWELPADAKRPRPGARGVGE